MPGYPCCCKKCRASFTVTHISGNQYEFTDTSPGSHTRQFTSEDGGSSTSSPWTHTFPTDRMYWVELEITLPDETTCLVRHYIGDLQFCDSCNPNLVGETVYVTIPPVSQGTLILCEHIPPLVGGTWAIDNLTSNGCGWGVTVYVLGTCVRCSNPMGDVGNHALTGSVSIAEEGWPTVTAITITANLGVGPGSVSTDCNGSADGGGATYRKTIPVGVDGVDCRGSHTLTKISETASAHYIAWPSSVEVFIPG